VNAKDMYRFLVKLIFGKRLNPKEYYRELEAFEMLADSINNFK
jgi:hypothetical protein